uniref:RNA dependent RNA polymerase n=1 Tax=Bremia lactucae associated yuevirus-like virus 2 TaxID=2993323 RepID=A0A9E7VBV9_9VIRU|nr:MAG: RNA dependent RNA polymerase [Bremia lactucae associated yuevirus-like virus 2]
MSVLNDVATENGLTIRELATSCSHRDAKLLLHALRGKSLYRMEEIEYSQNVETITPDLLSVSNHYWIEDDKVYWGTPKGSFSSYINRLLKDPKNWRDDAWSPDVRRECDETRARDMLGAAYLFPFSGHDSHPALKLALIPMLKTRREIIGGSMATAKLLESIAYETEEYSVLSDARETSAEKVADSWVDFSSWCTYFEVSTSISPYDAPTAGQKMDYIDRERVITSTKYSLLAEFANTAEHVIRTSGRKGMLGRNLNVLCQKIKRLRSDLTETKNPTLQRALIDDILTLEGSIMAEFRRTRSGASCVYRNSRSEHYKMIAIRNVVMVQFTKESPIYLLNNEDLKNLKFVAMSHTMWHYYAATISMEWSPKTKFPPLTTDEELLKALSAMGQLGAKLDATMASLKLPIRKKSGQTECSKVDAEKCIANIWAFYKAKLSQFISMELTDYFGRYLSELFSVYTSVLGGHLAESGYKAQLKEFEETWMSRDIYAKSDIDRVIEIFSNAPMTLVQDFGRLSKIVYAYDINPAYSYIARVNDMKVGNERGIATFTSDFNFIVKEHTENQRSYSLMRLRCAIRVLLAVGDARSAASAAIPAEDAPTLEDASWEKVMAYFKKDASTLGFSSVFIDPPAYAVPKEVISRARREAKEFYKSGSMPTTPWAGAFMDTSNMLAYKERGEPDIALLKATSIPPSDIYQAMSSMPGPKRMTPTRDTDGARDPDRGDMISEYLTGNYPSRNETIDWLKTHTPLMSTSVKIETGKYPGKNRIITSAEAHARRCMSEIEFNNGKCFQNVPGFTIGADPSKVKRKMYAAMREDVARDKVRLKVSLDLSSWSTGMHWDVQEISNDELRIAYDGGADMFSVLDNCTKGTYMIMAQKGLRLPSVNERGSNYEGLDGKRNTLLHCALWYMARCTAYDQGLEGEMTALLFIDDGTAVMDVPKKDLQKSVKYLRQALLSTYVEYGFKLSIYKTVISTTYCQFLNEVYFHGAHIGYGFRALCHTGAQTFPEAATVAEELSVISSGIRGAAVSGGHTLRLMAGYHHLLMMYMSGMIGNRGRSIGRLASLPAALMLVMPTIARGFGLPSMTELFSNLAGHRDVEKLDKLPRLLKALRLVNPSAAVILRCHFASCMRENMLVNKGYVANRVTIKNSIITAIGPRNRARLTAEGALLKCNEASARPLLEEFLRKETTFSEISFPAAFISAYEGTKIKLPVALVEKALACDPADAVSKLVKKIVSSNMISKYIPRDELTTLKRAFYSDGKRRVADMANIFGSTVYAA